MKSYKTYVFDLDDTLLATFSGVTRLHYPLLAERLGLRYGGEEAARRTWGRGLAEGFSEVFAGDAEPDRILTELARLHQEHPLTPAEGAVEILRVLRKHGKFIAVVTAGDPRIAESSLRRGLGLPPEFFDCVYFTAKKGTPKPSPAILNAIFAEHERVRGERPDPSEVIYIGDSLADYRTAQTHGVDFAAVPPAFIRRKTS